MNSKFVLSVVIKYEANEPHTKNQNLFMNAHRPIDFKVNKTAFISLD